MQLRFKLGSLFSFASLVVLFQACVEPRWAFDAVNSVDMGLWHLAGTGVQYKLINAGLQPDRSSNERTAFTLYSRFCSNPLVKDDPWCQGRATAARGCTVLALMASILGFIVSTMVALDWKLPTWDGAGKEATLPIPTLCALAQTMLMLTTTVVWQQMISINDKQCRTRLNIDNFDCITSGSSHLLAIVDVVLAAVTYLIWRSSHAWEVARRRGMIADGFTLASKTDSVDDILSGIANKTDIDANGSDGRNALHWACTLNRTSICHLLLKKGANIRKKDRDGWTPLHWASRVGNSDIVRLLSKYGANINVKDPWGTTPLMLTIVGESKLAAQTLIELGADVNARNIFGQTALMQCIESGSDFFQLSMVFINAGADVGLRDLQGMNALHYAAASGQRNLLLNMLQVCDSEALEKPNIYGETPVQVALYRYQLKTKEMLDAWMAGEQVQHIEDEKTQRQLLEEEEEEEEEEDKLT